MEKEWTRPQFKGEHLAEGRREREDWEKALDRLIARGQISGERENRLLMESRIVRSVH